MQTCVIDVQIEVSRGRAFELLTSLLLSICNVLLKQKPQLAVGVQQQELESWLGNSFWLCSTTQHVSYVWTGSCPQRKSMAVSGPCPQPTP